MKKILLLCIISCPFFGLFSQLTFADDSEKPKYTDEQLNKLKAAEEKYKDNPKVLELINNIKADAGITDSAVKQDPGPPPIMAHGKVITQGSYQEAEEAFKNKDNETAIAHYKVLAAEGDPEASLKLGYIYEQEGDSKAAYAAYKNAAESEHNTKDSKMASERLKWLEKDVMSEKEIEQANQARENEAQANKSPENKTQINQNQANKSPSNKSATSAVSINTKDTNVAQYRSVTPDTANSQLSKSTRNLDSNKPGTVKISPQRINKTQHFEAEKFSRSVSK